MKNKSLDNKIRIDWNIISIKIENLRKERMGLVRYYLIKDVEGSVRNYCRTHKTSYDPLNPPKGDP